MSGGKRWEQAWSLFPTGIGNRRACHARRDLSREGPIQLDCIGAFSDMVTSVANSLQSLSLIFCAPGRSIHFHRILPSQLSPPVSWMAFSLCFVGSYFLDQWERAQPCSVSLCCMFVRTRHMCIQHCHKKNTLLPIVVSQAIVHNPSSAGGASCTMYRETIPMLPYRLIESCAIAWPSMIYSTRNW